MAEVILVVEDDKSNARLLRYNLEREGYRVIWAADGLAGLAALRRDKPSLVILDLMLPKLDGFEFCRQARKEVKTSILMLTARKDETDKVLGLELGADDYVTKPYSLRELLARVKVLLRRQGEHASPAALMRAGAIELDAERYEVRVGARGLSLSTKEFDLLKLLLSCNGKALSREEILERLWGYDRSLEIDTRTVDQHVKRLREKLGPEAKRVLTVKNVGYRMKAD